MDAETKALCERLRETGRDGVWSTKIKPTHPICAAAIDMIERLSAENERLREALSPFAKMADVFEASISESDAAGLSHEEARLRAYQSLTELRFAGHLDRARATLAGEVGHD